MKWVQLIALWILTVVAIIVWIVSLGIQMENIQ